MSSYGAYVLKRLAQFVLVVFIGINITYLITHLSPIDPVEQAVTAVTAFGSSSPEAINMLRQALRELYGLDATPMQQYLHFWERLAVLDFGPSLSAFPDAGLDADLAGPALDHRPPRDGGPDQLGRRATSWAASPATIGTAARSRSSA